MVQGFRPIPRESKSGLIEVASNIWTIEAKECVCYRPPMQPRYPYTHRAVVMRLNDDSLFILSPIQLTLNVCADIDRLGVVSSPGRSSVVSSPSTALVRTVRSSWRQDAPPITRTMVRLIGQELTFTDHKAQEELGYTPVVTRDFGLAQLVNLYRQEG